jgi:pimeloyl-ACP methyl ester carboxylesterase
VQAAAATFEVEVAPGVRLVAERWGAAARTVLLGHGGGQTRHAWDRTAPTLGELGWRAVAYDLRGHGDSAWHPSGDYRLDELASDVVALATHAAVGPTVAVGASVSGIAALLAVAELAPERFAGLVLVDVAPTLDLSGVERILGFMTAQLDEGFASVDEAADAIASYLPHRPRPRDLSGLAKNLRRGADGRFRWHWDPAFVRGPHWAAVHPHRERLLIAAERLTVPTLLVRGRRSALVTDEAVREFLAHAKTARFRDVSGADHMIAGDRNDAFNACVREFLDAIG